jgi:acetyl esterase/lipase
MKIVYLFTAFLLFSFFANSQTIDNMKLWPNQAPYSDGKATPMKEVRPAFFGNIGEAELDIYRPDPAKANGTAVIICPGGGYVGEALIKEGSDVAKWFNSYGVTGIVLKYRIPGADGVTNREKAPLSDAQRAIRYIRSKSAELSLKSNQIGIMGFSAGGHLASTAGTHYDQGDAQATDPVEKMSCRPDFMLLIYPVVSMDSTITHRGSRQNLLGKNPDPEKVKYYSADQNVTSDTPPTFLVHATDDKTVKVDNSINLYFALQRMGIPVEMHIFEKGGHGFGLDQMKGTALSWPDRCKGWLEQHNLLK